ncbi:MAG TPA: tRNA (adenosine(37)-N6)-threonylcarbamoyltransferase complex ATPase subunit type 1 TsaE [Pyrinomonadaceae bacterium]|nr:tRNA (adenosine(37)-N6)-threonylcarbamoyltransferase complex ATPase subunit type 1 TsaE [Pyrinomonadaceae bacterium]
MIASQHIATGEWRTLQSGETFRVGEAIGKQLRGGEILLLDGPLGAGKTIFVKGLAAGLEVDAEEVTSPSFTLVNPYVGRLPLFHIDLYRLDTGASAAHAVDLEELISDEKAVVVIEWAQRLGKYPLPPGVWHVQISGDGEAPRTILITQSGGKK